MPLSSYLIFAINCAVEVVGDDHPNAYNAGMVGGRLSATAAAAAGGGGAGTASETEYSVSSAATTTVDPMAQIKQNAYVSTV